MSAVVSAANMVRQYQPLSPLPSITHDLNLIVAESVSWTDLAETVRQAGGQLLEQICYRETYRDAKRDGKENKALFFSIVLRSESQTLTGEQAEGIRAAIVAACEADWGAKLLE